MSGHEDGGAPLAQTVEEIPNRLREGSDPRRKVGSSSISSGVVE